MTNEEASKILKCCIIDKCEDCPLKVENAYACTESSFAPTFVEVPKDVLLQVLELLKAQALVAKDKDVPTTWISVNDRLPEYEGDYLVTDGHRPPWKCRLMILAGFKGWSNDALKPAVKYWMPLPELPKEGDERV